MSSIVRSSLGVGSLDVLPITKVGNMLRIPLVFILDDGRCIEAHASAMFCVRRSSIRAYTDRGEITWRPLNKREAIARDRRHQ